MASGIFSVFDDVAALMDDVAVASKLATRKTAGILGDDLAVNAEKATGFLATRELPVLWAITKGSFINKLIIVPIALLLTAFSPVAIKVILVLGGFYLAYEGAEKIIEYLFHRAKKGHEVVEQAKENDSETEKSKVRSAVTTDFILSVEIVILALGTVLEESLILQIITVSIVSLLATVGVYGLVALIVRMDDIGFKLIKRSNKKGLLFKLGHLLVKSLPLIIKFLGFIGTIALFLVSGGIFVHNIELLHHVLPQLQSTMKEFLFGLAGGLLVLAVVWGVKKILSVFKR
jgi:predicted DNA repair protein MutK